MAEVHRRKTGQLARPAYPPVDAGYVRATPQNLAPNGTRRQRVSDQTPPRPVRSPVNIATTQRAASVFSP